MIAGAVFCILWVVFNIGDVVAWTLALKRDGSSGQRNFLGSGFYYYFRRTQ